MKKVLLVLVLGLGFVACSEVEVNCEPQHPTTDLRLDVSANANKSKGVSIHNKTNVDVNRDNIPATVETIDVTVSSTITPIEVNSVYTLVDDGSGENGFIVQDVALGLNNVVATTTTVANGSFNVSRFNTNAFTPQQKLDANGSNVPYAIYNGEVLDVDITGNNDLVNVPMTTDNGRLNTVIVMEESIRSDYYFEVITWTSSVPPTSITPTNSSKGVSLYWSDENSIAGAQQGVTINVYTNNGTFVYGENTVLNVVASTGTNTLLTINATDVQAQQVGFSFSFQPWVEVNN